MENRNTLLAKLLRGLELIRVEHDRGVEGDLAIRIGLVEAADVGNVHALNLARRALNELKHVTHAVGEREDAHGVRARIVRDAAGIRNVLDEEFLARRRTHGKRHAKGVALHGVLVGDDDPGGVELLGPHQGDLSVNQTVIDSNLNNHCFLSLLVSTL